MLTHLSIKNYALIDHLEVAFTDGFTTITGETGAGKSILLGALSLVVGKRADLNTLKNKETKCVVEAQFAIGAYQLQPLFVQYDLDFEFQSVFRREILPSGKSRAFINDTPVNLNTLNHIGSRLIDVHSQHQTLELTDNNFQFKLLDGFAANQEVLADYHKNLKQYKQLKTELANILETNTNAQKDLEYQTFLWQELQEAKLHPTLLEDLEEEYEQLSNVETIRAQLALAYQTIAAEDIGITTQLQEVKQQLAKLGSFGAHYQNLHERLASVFIEVEDINQELSTLNDGIEANPERLEQVSAQLSQLQALLQKHQVIAVSQLQEIEASLEQKIANTQNSEAQLAKKQEALKNTEVVLQQLCNTLKQNREAVIPKLKTQLEHNLQDLGMPAAEFLIKLEAVETFTANGNQELTFLLKANKGTAFGELKKVASGGELSRIMLVIKSIMASYDKLPTLIFDEIDTGVSGQISAKMGGIMKQMTSHMQIFAITHLPQVAAQGHQQYKVFKQEDDQTTTTQIKQLDNDGRINELATMLGGTNYTSSAKVHAKQLLEN